MTRAGLGVLGDPYFSLVRSHLFWRWLLTHNCNAPLEFMYSISRSLEDEFFLGCLLFVGLPVVVFFNESRRCTVSCWCG